MASAAVEIDEQKESANTPMMRQYLEVKALHPDSVLFFRLGDFYEMFFEDAVRAAEILQITLTSRSKGSDRVPMCGVPYHSARKYIARLIESGLKVAICDQVEEPGGKGIVRREVTRVVTPGTVLDEDALEPKENRFLAALHAGPETAGAALLDASTGEFFAFSGPPAQIAEELARFSPCELLVPEEEAARGELSALLRRWPGVPIANLPRAAFEAARAEAYLKQHLKVASLDGFGLSGQPWAVGAAGAALRYLVQTQKADASHVDRLFVHRPEGTLGIDEASRLNLEVLRTLRDGSRKGSLLGVLDRTQTGMGARKLVRWLATPLATRPEIEARLDAVEELSSRAAWREELGEGLRGVSDLERLCARLCLGVGNARDLRSLANSLLALPKISAVLARCKASLLLGLGGPLNALGELSALLNRAVADEPPITLKEGGLVRPGFDGELDELVALCTSGKDHLLRIEERERERTGISSLKVRYNKVFGYYLEVTRSNLHLVPTDYHRKQTTVGAERFVTPELKEYEEKVLTAEERRCALEYQLFERLRAEVVERAASLRAAAEAVAAADVLLSLARCAVDYGYVRPVIDETGVLEIVGGRHPVVERMLQKERFVPNDVRLDCDDGQILVITGPNMAGKSTAMRQVALITLMAQAGSFVPAQKVRLGLCDRIFTRVGAADNLAQGQSTFMVEMTETANILHHASRRSLVILDEIGRGTSTFDGLSIAWAVAEHLHDHTGARTLFATHYHELTDLAREKTRVRNCSIAVKEVDGRVVFLRKLVAGGANRSYGIEVAKLAGLPGEVIRRARQILGNLESGELDREGRPRLTQPMFTPAPQLPLFATEPALTAPERNALEGLRRLRVEETTPLQALNAVAELQRLLREG
jgi:DNA mismatch repair protein MutS